MKATRQPELVCEYRIWCPECGDKLATWSIDGPNAQQYVENSFERQYQEVTFPTHAKHGTFTIIDERSYPYAQVD